MKWKKKTTPSPSLSLTKPQWNSTAPDEADKVADQLLEMVSGPQNAVEREYTLTEVQLKNTSTAAGKTNYTTAGDMNLHSGYTAGQCDLCTEQFLITRVNLLIYGLNFYTLYSLNLACAFRSSNYHHHKWNVTLFVVLLCIYIYCFLLHSLMLRSEFLSFLCLWREKLFSLDSKCVLKLWKEQTANYILAVQFVVV